MIEEDSIRFGNVLSKQIIGMMSTLPNDILSIFSEPLERFESGILRFWDNFKRIIPRVYSPKGTNFLLLYISILSEKKTYY